MATRLARLATVVVLALAAVAALRAAADAPPAPVPLTLVITDTRGGTPRNFTTADFEIIEGGEKRTIASISPRALSPRIVGLMLDEFHVRAGAATERVRTSMLAFVDRHLRDDDVVFVMKPLDPQTAIQPAGSLAEVRQRIATFQGRKGDFTPRSSFERQYMGASQALAARQRAQVVRSGLEALAVAMRDSRDAPKALIVLTEGFAAEYRDRVRASTLRATTRAAALSNIPVYVIDPSGSPAADGPFTDIWKALAAQTAGALVTGTPDLSVPLHSVGIDLAAQFVLRFNSSGKQDGGFHDLQLRSRRTGAVVRGPSGYWAPFPPSRFPPVESRSSKLLTPHVTGLIQPWFQMSPGAGGRTRITFIWSPRPDGPAAHVEFAALTFEGATVHEAMVSSASMSVDLPAQTSFEVTPGPLQISLAINSADKKLLGRDVRYITVPNFDAAKPVIAGVEFIRPRSLPEFTLLQSREDAVPTTVREFVRQDRLLIRVRAFAGIHQANVRVQLLNRSGHVLIDLTQLPSVGGAAQFSLPLARYARGEYRLRIRAAGAGDSTTQLVPLYLIG